jgi:hypothetical protein
VKNSWKQIYSKVVTNGQSLNLRPLLQISPSFSAIPRSNADDDIRIGELPLFIRVNILQEPRNRTTEKICKISFDIPLLIPLNRQGDEDQTLYGAKNVSVMWHGLFQTMHRILRVSLQGPDISGMGECKKSPSRNQKPFPSWGNVKQTLCCGFLHPG